jgi:hypothetical protein
MSISKSQLTALNSGVLESFGELESPDINEGVALERVLFNIAKRLTEDLRDSATKKGVVATKTLRSSIAPTPAFTNGDTVEVGIVMDKQWRYAEKGRRPGKRPPIKPIEEWITSKGIKLNPAKGQSTLEARHSLAIAISKKIGKKGTIKRFQYKGSGFIKSVLSKANMEIIAEHLAELQGQKIRLYFKVQ